ncbi:MAG: hypothetical protein MK312_04885, partial [Roseibacillus sp.]|nr:hypothetical protein [Roseibacillus sp.]
LIFAYLVPAIFISIMLTGNPIPQLGLGANVIEDGAPGAVSLLDKLNGLSRTLDSKHTLMVRSPLLMSFLLLPH